MNYRKIEKFKKKIGIINLIKKMEAGKMLIWFLK